MATRKIIEIDEEKCNGCGQCILACAEGALELVNGKAKIVGDIYCDGLGACIGECPEDALTIIERDAVDFDEDAVEELLEAKKKHELPMAEGKMACGCPSSMSTTLTCEGSSEETGPQKGAASQLGHWPIKLQLLNPQAPYLKDADLVLLADCSAAAYPDLHQNLLKGRIIAMGCPKLDNLDAHIDRLASILKESRPKSLTVLHMEVPCCKGFVVGAEKAIEKSGYKLPLKRMMIGQTGQILEQEDMSNAA